jgi:hypothetical protein
MGNAQPALIVSEMESPVLTRKFQTNNVGDIAVLKIKMRGIRKREIKPELY